MGKKVAIRAVRILDRLTDLCILLVCVVVLSMCAYALYDNFMIYNNAVDNSVLTYRPVKNKTLVEAGVINDDQVAWLTIDDTTIDFPVMQADNNSKYLNMDPYGNYSLSGSIFVDYRCAGDFSNMFTLLYGHHMQNGAMFGALDNYKDATFFYAHRTGTLTVKDKIYDIMPYAVVPTDVTAYCIFYPSDEDIEELVQYIDDNALYKVDPIEGANIVGLSTCADATSGDRLVVFCNIVEREEQESESEGI